MIKFVQEHIADLEAFALMSQTAGARNDYVQGGGGNTSVKLSGGLMAIKASGYCLSDITPEKAYAVLDCAALSAFYRESDPKALEDVEKQGSARAKENTLAVEGLAAVRPSVEAGFHSILKKFVCHTHSVYANLAACSDACREIAAKAFDGADYSWGWVPYTDPGANLTFAIRDELARVEKETGRQPAVILMQNHGIIAHDDDAKTCLAIHADANERLARAFGVTGDSFPKVSVKETDSGIFTAECDYLKGALRSGRYDYSGFIEKPLYPDQMVFLIGTLYENKPALEDGEASIDLAAGTLTMRMNAKKARVIAETLTCVVFIMDTIRTNGLTVSTMGEAAKRFIANWESEKYRRSLAGK